MLCQTIRSRYERFSLHCTKGARRKTDLVAVRNSFVSFFHGHSHPDVGERDQRPSGFGTRNIKFGNTNTDGLNNSVWREFDGVHKILAK